MPSLHSYAWNPAVGPRKPYATHLPKLRILLFTCPFPSRTLLLTQISLECLSMWTNTYVCVGVPGSTTGLPPPPPTPTQTGPQPQMPGVVSYCKKYYLVQPGDTCATIDAKEGTSLLQIVVWNPYINIPQCTNLWLGYYICVGA